MRLKTLVGIVAVAIAVTTQAGTAQAQQRMDFQLGGPDGERMRGTPWAEMLGSRGGDDDVYPGGGADIVRAGTGDDYVFLRRDGRVDRIHCGEGFDTVAYMFIIDPLDIIDDNCEGVIA